MDLVFEDIITREVPEDDSTSHEEKMILYNHIRELRPEIVVETGTHRGLTSFYLAHALHDNEFGHLYTADPYEWGAKGNFRKIPELAPYITYHQIRGSELKNHINKIDFFFCDGYHEKEEVLEEVDALFPLLTDGAVVYFHDSNDSAPTCDIPGAINERGLEVEYIRTKNGMARYNHRSNPDADTEG
jgi:predicted O-methyltransferase YrrM